MIKHQLSSRCLVQVIESGRQVDTETKSGAIASQINPVGTNFTGSMVNVGSVETHGLETELLACRRRMS